MRKIFAIVLLCVTIPSLKAQETNKNTQDLDIAKSMEIFFNTFRSVNAMYVDSTSPSKMVKTAITSMLEELDPYTEYIPEEEMSEFDFMTTGKYAGIGSLIRQRGEWVEISEPYKGTPADRAGLKAGDLLLEIDGKSLKGIGSAKVSSMLKGDPNTTFKLKYRPIKDTNTTKEVDITREKISVPSVPYAGIVGNNIGYIRYTSFTDDGAQQVENALKELQNKTKLKGLIIDLRGNGGGVVDAAVGIAGMFLPTNTEITSLRGRAKQSNHNYVSRNAPIDLDLPLTILIDRGSASASEILAGAIQDLDRGVIIGRRSFGKGLVQTTRPVANNALVKVTIAKYYTPAGRCIQAIDYTHRNDDGSVKHIPDSLIQEFKTKNGRKVYDGGGINPDIKSEGEFWSKFTTILYAYGFIDDFANIYAAQNEPVEMEKFKVDDNIYNNFITFMKDKKIDYISPTQNSLKEMRKEAESEKMLEKIAPLLDSIERSITDDKDTMLREHAQEIKQAIASAIITRWYYNKGSIAYNLLIKEDKEVLKAIEIISNPEEYNRIITKQDTSKN